MTEPVHIKLDFGESINSKRELLSSQIDLLNILKRFKNYSQIRKSELIQKNKLKTRLKELNQQLKNLKNNLPKVKEKEQEEIKQEIEIIERKSGLESELRDIQERLRKLNE